MPETTAQPLTPDDILATARRVLWSLQAGDKATARRIANTPALAVTRFRHGREGAAFARSIIERTGATADTATVETAIKAALLARGKA